MRAVDFFCGAGGMTRGMLDAGIDVLGGIDIHLPCQTTYEQNNIRHNGENSVFIAADVEELTSEELANTLGVNANEDNLILIGCSPCQFWSKVNTNREKSTRSSLLLRRFQNFVEALLPGYVVIENVPGLNTRREEAGLNEFHEFLRSAGYTIADNVVNVSHYGVPQKRRRYVLVASRIGGNIGFPAPIPEEERMVNVRHHLGPENGFPPIQAGHVDETGFMHTSSALSERNLQRIMLTPLNGGRRDSWRNNEELQLVTYRGRDNQFSDVYGRMNWDEPAPTITTRFNSLSNGRFGHPEEHRALSLREGATLQTFPQDFAFVGNRLEIAKQIGNAVPPLLAQRIGEHILTHWETNGQLNANGEI